MIPLEIRPTKKCVKPKLEISDHIERCIDLYSKDYTKLDEKSRKMDGMIEFRARNLLNLLAEIDNCKYLQIGTWKGACLYSALYKNKLDYAFACDDFSQYVVGQGATYKDEKENEWSLTAEEAESLDKSHTVLNFDIMLNLIKPDGDHFEFDFYDGNCFSMPLNKIKQKINMYFYDGGHSVADHFLALYYYYPVLEQDFIFVCDDWSEEKVKVGTYAAIDQCQYKIVNSYVEQNMYIAHLQKNLHWGEYIARDRVSRKKSKRCILNSKGIIKKDNDK